MKTLTFVRTFIQTYRIEILIFLIAFAIRMLYLYVSAGHYGGLVPAIHGADGYFNVSNNLIAGHGFSQSQTPPYLPYSFRPPLYFYFLYWAHTLCNGYGGVIILQIVLGSLLPLMGMKLASYVLDSRKCIVTIGLLLAIEPQGILYSTMFYSETLFMSFFFLALLYLFTYVKGKQLHALLISGALMGLASLTRPSVEYLPIIIVATLLWESRTQVSKKLFVHLGAYLIVFLAVLAPWLYRNEVVFGVAELSPQLGVNLYTVLLPSVLSVEHGTTWDTEYTKLIDTGVEGPNVADLTKGSVYKQRAVPLLLAHPKSLAIVSANAVVAFFTMDGVLDILRHIGEATSLRLGKPALFVLLSSPQTIIDLVVKVAATPTIFVLFGRIFWILTTILFFYGAWRYLKRNPDTLAALLMILIVLYFALTTIIGGLGITARYRLPVNGFILVFAGYAVLTLWAAHHRKRHQIHA